MRPLIEQFAAVADLLTTDWLLREPSFTAVFLAQEDITAIELLATAVLNLFERFAPLCRR